jgi:adenosylhomocysteine nucleosidase
MERSLLIVTGLAREAREAEGSGVTTLCSGGDSVRLAAILDATDAAGFWGVVSFGLAGGLDPALEPGDLVLGAAVSHDGQSYEACGDLNQTLRTGLFARDIHVVEGAIAGVDAAVMTPGRKASLRASSGAVAVDMESHVAARWARDNALPFGIVRVISDPAHRALPPLAANALKPDGNVALMKVMLGLARAPGQIGALAHAGRDARAAFASLGRCRELFAGI